MRLGKLKQSRVFNNAMWIIVCRVIQAILAFLINVFTARYLGPSNFGLISYAASMVAFVVPIMRLGTDSILVKELVDDAENEDKILGSALIINLCMSIICIIGLILFVYIVNKDEKDTIIVCTLYSLLLIFQSIDIMQYWFQAKLLSKYTSIIMLIAYISVSIYKIILLVTAKSVYWFAVSNLLDYLIIAVLLVIAYFKLGNLKLKVSTYYIKQLILKGRYFIVADLMVTIYAQADRIMLKSMIGNEELAYYSVAASWATATGFVFGAIIDSMRPVIFESKKVSRKAFEGNVIKLYSVITYLSLAQCIILALCARYIIDFLYGTEYLPAITTLQILVWYTTFSYFGAVRNIWIIAEEKQQVIWKLNSFGVVVNIVLNYMVIPYMGSAGAALASLITQVVTNVVLGYVIKSIRRNNILMLKGLDLRVFISCFKSRKH